MLWKQAVPQRKEVLLSQGPQGRLLTSWSPRHCDFSSKTFCFHSWAPSAPLPPSQRPAAVANFATSWKRVYWAWMETSLAVLELLKTGNFKQNCVLWT